MGGPDATPNLWKQPFSAVRASGGYPGNDGTDSVGNIERPARLGVQFSGTQWTPIQESDKSTYKMRDFGDNDNNVNTKSNIITVWANIKCHRPSTLWVNTFNDIFGTFIGHHKNLQKIVLLRWDIQFVFSCQMDGWWSDDSCVYISHCFYVYFTLHPNALQVQQCMWKMTNFLL